MLIRVMMHMNVMDDEEDGNDEDFVFVMMIIMEMMMEMLMTMILTMMELFLLLMMMELKFSSLTRYFKTVNTAMRKRCEKTLPWCGGIASSTTGRETFSCSQQRFYLRSLTTSFLAPSLLPIM